MNIKIIVIGLLFSQYALAGDPHHPESIVYDIGDSIENYTENYVEDYSAASLGVALSGQQFDLSSDRWQASATYGMVEGNKAISIGGAKGYNGALITGSYAETITGKKVRAGVVGVSLKF